MFVVVAGDRWNVMQSARWLHRLPRSTHFHSCSRRNCWIFPSEKLLFSVWLSSMWQRISHRHFACALPGLSLAEEWQGILYGMLNAHGRYSRRKKHWMSTTTWKMYAHRHLRWWHSIHLRSIYIPTASTSFTHPHKHTHTARDRGDRKQKCQVFRRLCALCE